MEATLHKIIVLILAAGNSSRMGSPKFLLPYDEKRCFLKKIVEGYQSFGCTEIKVVLNAENDKLIQQNKLQIIDNQCIIVNSHSERERLYSVKIGLETFDKPDFAFIHPIDNPYVNTDILAAMVKEKNTGDYMVPTFNGKGGHPILVNGNIIQQIVHYQGNYPNLKDFLKDFRRVNIKVPTNSILLNINTREEYLNLFHAKDDKE